LNFQSSFLNSIIHHVIKSSKSKHSRCTVVNIAEHLQYVQGLDTLRLLQSLPLIRMSLNCVWLSRPHNETTRYRVMAWQYRRLERSETYASEAGLYS